MQNLLEELKSALQSDERLIVDGSLVKNKIVELALAMDEGLLALLLHNKAIKKQFFREVGGVLVFDKAAFQSFVSNKQFLPDSYTALKNKIGLTANREYLTESKEVVLAWPYKDCVLAGGQTKEDQKRKEIFWNETLAADEIDRLLEPKALTSFKKYDKDGEREVESVSLDDNLIIKGNNLLALHSLKKQYAGKVKLIYIDPPYNTGGATDTFTYNNSFKHSSWLTFIKNRLEISKNLLQNDGFLAITIDHEELFYLGALADEIFGVMNRVGIVTIYINPKGRQHERFFSASTEYMLVYAKNIELAQFRKVTLDETKANEFIYEDISGKYRLDDFARIRESTLRTKKPNFWYPIYVSPDLTKISSDKKTGWETVYPTNNGKEYTWKTKLDTFIARNDNFEFVAVKKGGQTKICNKYYEQQVFKNIWTDKKYFSEFQGTNIIKKLIGSDKFSYPKSLYSTLDTLKIMSSDQDIILDFFAGSGTTAHAVLGLNKEDGGNRRYILCEQMDYVQEVTVERVKAVLKQGNIDSSFIYCELAQHNANIIDKIEQANTAGALKAIWREMENTDFISYKIKPETINQNIHEFEALSLAEQKRFLIAVLDKNQLYVNYSEIDDADYQIPEADKKLNKQFYGE